MKSFIDLHETFDGQPARIGVLLNGVDVGRGREELYRDQVPELLGSLAEQTRIESIRASSAIEGVEVEPDRAERIAGERSARFRNRNEKEFAGYRDAIDELMRADALEQPSVPLMLHLHRRLYQHTGGRGGYLKTDDNLITRRDERGRREVIFKPPPWQETEALVAELFARYGDASDRGAAPPLVLLSALVVDLLAIHPVADGNGRVARLLTTHELLRLDYGVARYVSVEQQIYESRNSYYEALGEAQHCWHEAEHQIWPWTEYLLRVLDEAYTLFEARVAAARSMEGMTKQQRVRRHVLGSGVGQFRLRDLRKALPGISDQTFRIVLGELKQEGKVEPRGSGPGAIWVLLDRSDD